MRWCTGTLPSLQGITRGVEAKATPADKTILVLKPWDKTLEPDSQGEEPLARAFAIAIEQFEVSTPLRIETQIDLPAGAGLGCSAALGVAVIEAIANAVGEICTRPELAERALSWEKVFHGNPSGIDNTMAACGGLALYKKGEGLKPLKLNASMKLVVANSGQSSSTKEMVESVARQVERNTEEANDSLEAIASIVLNSKTAAENTDWEALGQLMDMNQALLSSFLLSTSKLEAMCKTARDAGAYGAKLTGAGGGGVHDRVGRRARQSQRRARCLA